MIIFKSPAITNVNPKELQPINPPSARLALGGREALRELVPRCAQVRLRVRRRCCAICGEAGCVRERSGGVHIAFEFIVLLLRSGGPGESGAVSAGEKPSRVHGKIEIID